MTDKTQPEALWLADALHGAVQMYPQTSEDEPGGYCTEQDQLMDDAATALCVQHARIAELEAELEAVGAGGVQALSAAPKPTCGKCKGLGYYDEGHENEDGTMGGGNYVDCERCKPVYREKLPDGKRCLHSCHKSEPCHTAP